jgi:protein N-terminal methyltransferase
MSDQDRLAKKPRIVITKKTKPLVTAGYADDSDDGKEYATIDEMWLDELGESVTVLSGDTAATATASSSSSSGDVDARGAKRQQWYTKGADYWASVAATDDGVLGGFGHVSPIDMRDSRAFLLSLPFRQRGAVIDCGAGIGRISKGLLMPLFDNVDLIEQEPKYVEEARRLLPHAEYPKMREFIVAGLQDWKPVAGSYDCVWIQWVIGHVPDDDFVALMARCVRALAPGGFICVKENIVKEGFVLDTQDSSISRSDALFRGLFAKSKLRCVAFAEQTDFPSELFPVNMYALQAIEDR